MTTTQILSSQQVADYERDGYLIVKGFFSPEEARRMYEVAIADEQIEQHSYDLNDQSGKRTKLALWYEPGDDIYGLAVRSHKMVGAVEQLLQGTPAHYHTKLMQKEPKVGGAWEWHQDYGYWYKAGFLYPHMLSVMVALTEATTANGCLQVLKGSHKLGRVEHGFRGDQVGIEQELIDAAMDHGLELVQVEIEPGDTLFFHCNTMHTSQANTSDNPRWSIISAYNRVDNKPYKDAPDVCTRPIDIVPDELLLRAEPAGLSGDRGFLAKETDSTLK